MGGGDLSKITTEHNNRGYLVWLLSPDGAVGPVELGGSRHGGDSPGVRGVHRGKQRVRPCKAGPAPTPGAHRWMEVGGKGNGRQTGEGCASRCGHPGTCLGGTRT